MCDAAIAINSGIFKMTEYNTYSCFFGTMSTFDIVDFSKIICIKTLFTLSQVYLICLLIISKSVYTFIMGEFSFCVSIL